MKTQLCPYVLTRRVLYDNAVTLGNDTVNYVLGLVRARKYQDLAQLSNHLGGRINTPHTVATIRQIEAFFKKNADFAVDAECEKAAIASFERGERICRITNRRLDYYYFQRDRLDPDLELYMSRMERFIRNALGDYDAFFETIPSRLRVTSGATALSPRRQSMPFMKLKRTIDCSTRTSPYLKAAYRFFGYAAPKVEEVNWNRVEFVPKSWKTHRAIACEPTGNIPFQLAFDDYVKSRLRKHGVDLSDQTLNQRLAYEGSVGGGLATVDLSMASDTLSFNTVAWLLPQSWFRYLNDVRCPGYRLKGGPVLKYAKFSSMGNGATFGLETLIFYAAVRAVGSKRGTAYGDDLIIESELYPALIKLLRFLGFIPNEDKSFAEGPFRESCGKDYFNGVDVTPFYLRSTEDWDIPNLCHNINGIARVCPYGTVWDYLRDLIDSAGLPMVPYSYNTRLGVFIHPSHAYDKKLIRSDHGVLKVKGFVTKTKSVTCWDSRALSLWFLGKSFLGNHQESLLQMLSSDPYQDLTQYRARAGVATRYTASDCRFKQKWVGWIYPAGAVPDSAYALSDFLLRTNCTE